MDAIVRRPSSRVHTFIAFTVFACISLVLISGSSRTHTIVAVSRREVLIRQNGSTPSSLSALAISITSNSTSSTTFLHSKSTSSTATSPSAESTIFQSLTTARSSLDSSLTGATTSSTTSSDSTITSSQSSSTAISSLRSTTTSLQSSTSVTPTGGRAPGRTSTKVLSPTTTTSSIMSSNALDNPVPATTLSAATNFLLPSSTDAALSEPAATTSEIAIVPTSVSAAAHSSGFWQKKSAVAATFVIVSLVFLAIAAVAVIAFIKRRSKRKQEQLQDELFEKHSENDHRSNSPGPSINSAPMDAFASRNSGFLQSNPFYADTRVIVQSSTPVQHPDYYNQKSTPTRYISPSESQAARTAAPPTAFRSPAGRAQLQVGLDSYPISIDSFYGAAGQPTSSGHTRAL